MIVKIHLQADMPADLLNAWLQHVRDFDTAHPGCVFLAGIDALDLPMDEAVKMLQVDPALSQIFKVHK